MPGQEEEQQEEQGGLTCSRDQAQYGQAGGVQQEHQGEEHQEQATGL